MSVIDKLEKEYEEEPKRPKSQVNIFERIVGDKEYSQPLDPQVKRKFVVCWTCSMIFMIQNWSRILNAARCF